MSGVMTLMGIRLPLGGSVLHRLQSSARQPPVSMVAGISMRWLPVRMTMRAMCGTASPRKEMGPQKAVVVAVSRPVQQSNALRVRRILVPRLAA